MVMERNTMDTCRSCGARVSPDLAWCGLCFTPVRADAGAPVRPEALPSWVQARVRATLESEPEPVLSRWHAGETSFGGLGRFLLSFGVLCALVAGYPIARGGMFMLA